MTTLEEMVPDVLRMMKTVDSEQRRLLWLYFFEPENGGREKFIQGVEKLIPWKLANLITELARLEEILVRIHG